MGSGYIRRLWVIARRTLKTFWTRHADAEGPLRAWFAEAGRASWSNPQDIKNRYASADFVGTDRVIFNIGGNRYRLIAAVDYARHIVFIKFVGTHAEYDRVDAATIDISR